jgi:hypothetical protein
MKKMKMKYLKNELERKLKNTMPTVSKDSYAHDIITLVRWCQNNWSDSDYRNYAIKYLKSIKRSDLASIVSKCYRSELIPISTLGSLVLDNQYVSPEHQIKLENSINTLSKYIKQEEKPVETKSNVISIQQRIIDTARKHAAEIDHEIDLLFLNSFNSTFSIQTFLSVNEISSQVAKVIASFYEELSNEISLVLSGSNDQLNEAYAHMTRSQLKKYFNFLSSIIQGCQQKSVIQQRKPRKRKEKSPLVLTKSVKFLREFGELKLRSIEPPLIINSTELWVYNTERRKLIVYRAASGQTLTVKGTTVMNYDIATSEMKTLRKPDEFFKTLTAYGKRAMSNAWKSIRGKSAAVPPRLNAKTILLAAN